MQNCRDGSLQFSLVTQSYPTLCDPMNRSTPGLLVHHQLLEFTQTHVHRVGDTIQPSHPLSSPSPQISLPSPSPSHSSRLIQSPCLSFLRHTANSCWLSIYIGNVNFHVTLNIHLTLSSPLTISISLFSMSVSPLLACK